MYCPLYPGWPGLFGVFGTYVCADAHAGVTRSRPKPATCVNGWGVGLTVTRSVEPGGWPAGTVINIGGSGTPVGVMACRQSWAPAATPSGITTDTT